ncbi:MULTISPECIES: HD domain-containing protein [Burkholderiales]|uniref:HD domain-containing protein n=1 Tax=Burkholderiales TaxID=80840 RepID=UPI0002E2DD78|nr:MULTISPECIES: hypothetical protein [Burkholderiales]
MALYRTRSVRHGQLSCALPPHRRYHSLQHLGECIAQLEGALDLAVHAGDVEIALWFHDAIYGLQAKDNEQRSADWAAGELTRSGAGEAQVRRVRALIMATCHTAKPADADQQLLVDIDLAILGAEPARFAEYEPVMPAACLRPLPPWSSAAIPGRRKRSPTDMPSPQ